MNKPFGPPTRHSPARIWRRWIRRSLELLVIGTTLYLAVALISEVGWRDLADELQTASPRLVAAVCALLALRYLAWNSRWQLALHRVGVHHCFVRGLIALLAAAAVNHLTPSFRVFGGLLRARYISGSRSVPFAATYGAVLFDQIANQVLMGALSASAFIAMALHLGRAREALAGALAVVALVLLVPLISRHLRRPRASSPRPESGDEATPTGLGRWLRPLASRGRDVLLILERLLRDPSLVAGAVVLGLAYAALNLGAAWVAFLALGQTPPVSSVFLAVSLGVTIGALSGTPGGSLTTEAAMVTCYGLLGIDRSVALAATLLYRGLHYVLILSLGVPSLATLEFLHRRRSRRADTGDSPNLA